MLVCSKSFAWSEMASQDNPSNRADIPSSKHRTCRAGSRTVLSVFNPCYVTHYCYSTGVVQRFFRYGTLSGTNIVSPWENHIKILHRVPVCFQLRFEHVKQNARYWNPSWVHVRLQSESRRSSMGPASYLLCPYRAIRVILWFHDRIRQLFR